MCFVVAVLSMVVPGACLCRAQAKTPLLDKIGVRRGICVVLGDAECRLALEIVGESELLVYVQLTQTEDVETARRIVDQAGFYGTRIFIAKGPLTKLHLADSIADALVAAGGAVKVPTAEALRVVRPGGKALLGGKVIVKPPADGIDDWSHPYRGPDNNPQSKDRVIVAPYLTQFLADPRYAPVPQVTVASGGRVFKAFGHIAFKRREEPFLNKLVAFNGYNGTMLWQRDITPGIMVHRNTMIATPDALYIGDDISCKVIDAETGEITDEIIPPKDVAGGTFWKWMGMEDGVLYALMGEQEQKDPIMRWRRERHGWPWNPISKGFNQPDGIRDTDTAYLAHPWGYGRNVLAIDPKTKKVLWRHRENEPVDSRAMCMSNGRIYIFRFGAYLACLDAETGKCIWRKTPADAPALFAAIGKYSNRQGPSFNWRTTSYLKCSEEALYFAGPQVGKLAAVSAKTGQVLWTYPYGNFQLILRDDALYGISGQNDQGSLSKKFDPLTGEVLAELHTGRRSCTRPTGTLDAIFYRAKGGSTRFDLDSRLGELISPMRPSCQDGVTVANGLLYWWPYVCDCQLTLYGITCLGPAGEFDFTASATEETRLETHADNLTKAADFSESSADWPTFRADNTCSAATTAAVPGSSSLLWEFDPQMKVSSGSPPPTAPVTAGGLVFVAGCDGIVRALDAATGKQQWKAYTGGPIRIPPTIWKGRAFVGSADGYIYSFEAATGRLLWRFRAAPVERRIPVYGSLLSTWPASAGVIVEEGIAYAAAGIVNYDGTYVYALDAATGEIKWQNNTSGHLDSKARTGVSVQGHMLLNDGKLYLAGGNAVSPAVYDTTDGKCLNDPALAQRITQNNVLLSHSARGWELSLLGDRVVACGRPFYAHPQYEVYDASVFGKAFLASSSGSDVAWVSNQDSKQILCYDPIDRKLLSRGAANMRNSYLVNWARLGIRQKPRWSRDCKESTAVAVCSNAVVVAEESKVFALSLKDGSLLWSCALGSAPVEWGLAVDRRGRAIVALKDGKVLCFGKADPDADP